MENSLAISVSQPNHSDRKMLVFNFSILIFLGDCTGNARLQFANNNGAVQIKKFQIKIKVGKGRLQLHNLFNGDRALGELKQRMLKLES